MLVAPAAENSLHPSKSGSREQLNMEQVLQNLKAFLLPVAYSHTTARPLLPIFSKQHSIGDQVFKYSRLTGNSSLISPECLGVFLFVCFGLVLVFFLSNYFCIYLKVKKFVNWNFCMTVHSFLNICSFVSSKFFIYISSSNDSTSTVEVCGCLSFIRHVPPTRIPLLEIIFQTCCL